MRSSVRRIDSHRVLGLRHGEGDPVSIIRAAQIRLRRWRRMHASVPAASWRRRVQLIVAARDDLLAQSVGRSSWR
jgi:hypothetical protein